MINYFCKTLNVNKNYLDINKTTGAIKYLLKRFDVINKNKPFNIPEVKPIDFLLGLVDYNKNIDKTFYDILDIEKLQVEFLNYFSRIVNNANYQKKNIIKLAYNQIK